ncbi:sodium:calcium antiporter [Salarchaeum japonicum]|uniref:Calcium/sodium antiporter n=1 Tax=Salarchaeum japonicum TaxID=555573 RepID=A0AAV3SYU4_9EURY|nr:sodium:calcium antiporter [Salarchaeum japonicum]
MLATVALLVVGVAMLVFGGDRAVEGTSALARRYGVSTFFVGITVVAVGSSLPEIATAIYGSLYGAGDLVVGHIVGSATSQITLGIGVVALVGPLVVSRGKVAAYGGGMLAAMTVMAALVATGGGVSHLEGVLAVALYVVFLAALYEHEDYGGLAERTSDTTRARAALRTVVGLALVVAGGHVLVSSGRALAVETGVPAYLVGVVTGLGTTLPEITVAVLAVRRDREGIAVGTLLGSNITDPLFSLGVGAAVGGLAVSGNVLLPIAYMTGVSAVVLALLAREGAMERRSALACLLCYLPAVLL